MEAGEIIEALDAEVIRSIYPAADQSGYDGGWCMATGPDEEDETWAETREELNDQGQRPAAEQPNNVG